MLGCSCEHFVSRQSSWEDRQQAPSEIHSMSGGMSGVHIKGAGSEVVVGGGAVLNRVDREVFTERVRFEPRLLNQTLGSLIRTLLAEVPFLGLFPKSVNTTPSNHQFLPAVDLPPSFVPEMMGKNGT